MAIDWDSVVEMSTVGNKSKETKKPRKGRNKIDDDDLDQMITVFHPFYEYSPRQRLNLQIAGTGSDRRRVCDVAMIADAMLLGVGKHLRRCGIDVLLPDDRNALVRIARRDTHRVILSNGKAYVQVQRRDVG
jgi:hypothetical protein